MNNAIRILILLTIVIILSLLFYFFQGGLSIKIGEVGTQKNAFEDYKVETNFKDGMFRVEVKDLVTSTGSGEKQYYRYDLTFDMQDKKSARRIQDNRERIALIINSVMSSFAPEELDSEPERMRVKQLIALKIEEQYPDIKINDLYFTNYVYN